LLNRRTGQTVPQVRILSSPLIGSCPHPATCRKRTFFISAAMRVRLPGMAQCRKLFSPAAGTAARINWQRLALLMNRRKGDEYSKDAARNARVVGPKSHTIVSVDSDLRVQANFHASPHMWEVGLSLQNIRSNAGSINELKSAQLRIAGDHQRDLHRQQILGGEVGKVL
jgi:hypothetical protein